MTTYEVMRHHWAKALLLIATILLFTPNISGQFNDYQVAIWNLGHIGYFFLLTASLLPYLQRHFSSLTSRIAVALLITLLLSVVIEAVQLIIGRQASVDDLLNNLLGSLLALSIFQLRLRLNSRMKLGLISLLTLLLICSLTPLLSITADTLIAHHKHPIIADFETPFEQSRWDSKRPLKIVQHESKQLRVHISSTDKHPGFTLTPRVSDWRGYAFLQFEIYNSGDQTWPLYFRINDNLHHENGQHYNDRYNTQMPLKPGWNQFQINLQQVKQAPAKRAMEMARIANVTFFFMDSAPLKTIRLDNLVLLSLKDEYAE
ncbi:MAG: VanZ family protein [Gammaproteobacteria bacterium]|nr:VanZ family protein [Gammaproteobacteria bacterium]MCF6230158.1 VanZ family protein [Gammaproteobacteria bacterium]